VGFVGNLRYLEMLDLMLGFAAIDIAGDDGTEYGSWPWQRRAILTNFKPQGKEGYTKCPKCKGYYSLPKGVDGPGGKSPFDKMSGADKKPKKQPPLCRCKTVEAEPEAEPVEPAAVAARPEPVAAPAPVAATPKPEAAAAAPKPEIKVIGSYDPDEAKRLSTLRP